MFEDRILEELSVDNVRAHVERITTSIPSRLAGSENASRMAQYSAEGIRKAGLDAEVYTLPALVSFPEPGELRVIAPEEKAIAANTLGNCMPTLPEGMAGDLVYVGSGFASDYNGEDVIGKITLSELSYSPARHEKQRIAGLKGSIAQIMRNWGHPDNEVLPFGGVKPAWGNPTPDTIKTQMPTIPCLGISRTAGRYLLELLEKGPVRVWLRANVQNCWRDIQITVAEMMVPESRDFVLVGGHQDSWYGPQASDNAAGNACMIELARVFSKYRKQLRRGLIFGFWTAHETGTMAGSSWYVDRNWDRLREHAVAYIQIDQPGIIGTTRWGTLSNVEMRRFHQAIERRLLGETPVDWHRASKTGDSSLFGLGVPTMTAHGRYSQEQLEATALATLGWWHHSLENTIDKLDWALMADVLKVHAAYIWELCTIPVLPFEFISVADQFEGRLEELRNVGGLVGLDEVISRADELQQAAARLDEAARCWRERYRSGSETTQEPADLLNRCMKRLSRLLIPIASTAVGTYGHDPYGFTPQTTMIPTFYELPQLADLPQCPERWQLETRLVRERNKVADALADARREIDQTLACLKK